ncbi:hypothetical protein FRC11_013037, partial [Ceratobasidium sp. 423]
MPPVEDHKSVELPTDTRRVLPDEDVPGVVTSEPVFVASGTYVPSPLQPVPIVLATPGAPNLNQFTRSKRTYDGSTSFLAYPTDFVGHPRPTKVNHRRSEVFVPEYPTPPALSSHIPNLTLILHRSDPTKSLAHSDLKNNIPPKIPPSQQLPHPGLAPPLTMLPMPAPPGSTQRPGLRAQQTLMAHWWEAKRWSPRCQSPLL